MKLTFFWKTSLTMSSPLLRAVSDTSFSITLGNLSRLTCNKYVVTHEVKRCLLRLVCRISSWMCELESGGEGENEFSSLNAEQYIFAL